MSKTLSINCSQLLGSLKSRYGGYIGIPTNYLYDRISEIERSGIRYKDKEINWSSKDGESLQNSLVLSEIEQVFGIARAIMQIKTHKLLLTSLYSPICLVSMYGTAHYFNKRMNLYARPLMVSWKKFFFYFILQKLFLVSGCIGSSRAVCNIGIISLWNLFFSDRFHRNSLRKMCR